MPERPDASDTIVTVAFVLRGALERVPDIKQFLQDRGFTIAFQKLSTERLYIVTEPPEDAR